jgi:hypothetical protein
MLIEAWHNVIRVIDKQKLMANDNQQRGTKDDQDKIQADLSGATLQTSEEYAKDKSGTPKDEISVSRTANRESEADKYAGSDRAGTAERKSQDLGIEEGNE